MQAQLTTYINYLKVERQAAARTLIAYRTDLLHVLEFAQQQSVQAWSDLQVVHMRELVSRLHLRGLKGRTIARLLSAVRGLYIYLLREGLCKHDPAAGIFLPKMPPRQPKILNIAHAQQLLDSPVADDFTACRDHAILELFYASGLRISELVALNLADLDMQQRLVLVLSIGKKPPRLLPVGSKAAAALEHWLAIRCQVYSSDPALFIGIRGRRMSQQSVRERVRKAGVRDLGQHVHPYMLRHSFASHILESCHDIQAVQELLGHVDISSTQMYDHSDFARAAQVYNQTHPRARRKIIK